MYFYCNIKSYASGFILSVVLAFSPVCATETSSNTSYAFLNLENRNKLFDQAKAGNTEKQVEVMDKYYSDLFARLKDESLIDVLDVTSWPGIQEKCYEDHRFSFFIIRELKPESIKTLYPKLIDIVTQKKDNGEPKYIHLYGWLCAANLATDPNPTREEHKGVKWFKAAGEKKLARGIYDAMQETHWVDADEQIRHLSNITTQGLAIAQYRLGKNYERAKKSRLAANAYTQAATQGHPAALNRLAEMYSEGKGVDRDQNKAMELWKKAVEQDDPQAQYTLGMAYYRKQDFPSAEKLFLKALEQDNQSGFYGLGLVYAKDRESTAIEYFQKGAEKKCPECCNELGLRYETGRGVGKNDQRAFEYYKLCPQNAHAQYKIGSAYDIGRPELGVSQEKRKAFDYYSSGAALGDADAQQMLGFMNFYGINYSNKDGQTKWEEQNIVQAVYWYTKSKDSSENTRNLLRTYLRFEQPSLSSLLTETQIKEECSNIVTGLTQLHNTYSDPNVILYKDHNGISHNLNKMSEFIESFRYANQYCLVLASSINDGFKNLLLLQKNIKMGEKIKIGVQDVWYPDVMRYHTFAGQHYITFDEENFEIAEQMCGLEWNSFTKRASEILKDLKSLEKHLDISSKMGAPLPEDKQYKFNTDIHISISTLNQLCKLDKLTLTSKLADIPTDYKRMEEIIGKMDHIILSRGIANQKKFLEEFPVYRD